MSSILKNLPTSDSDNLCKALDTAMADLVLSTGAVVEDLYCPCIVDVVDACRL